MTTICELSITILREMAQCNWRLIRFVSLFKHWSRRDTADIIRFYSRIINSSQSPIISYSEKRFAGMIHCTSGPAVEIELEKFSIKTWYHLGKLISTETTSPLFRTVISYRGDKTKTIHYIQNKKYSTSIVYKRNNVSHRDKGPAYIHKNEVENTQEWYQNGLLHCDNGPAQIKIKKTINGVKRKMKWYQVGKFIRQKSKIIPS